jgi:hypothetical protein
MHFEAVHECRSYIVDAGIKVEHCGAKAPAIIAVSAQDGPSYSAYSLPGSELCQYDCYTLYDFNLRRCRLWAPRYTTCGSILLQNSQDLSLRASRASHRSIMPAKETVTFGHGDSSRSMVSSKPAIYAPSEQAEQLLQATSSGQLLTSFSSRHLRHTTPCLARERT